MSVHATRRAMRTFASLLLLSALLAGGPARGADADVVERVSPSQLEAMLSDLGYTGTTIDEDGDAIVRMQGYNVLVLLGSYDGVYVALVSAFAGTRATLQDVNDWNREKRFARAYLDAEGDPVVESELDLAGGVTVARVKDFVQTFAQLTLPDFVQTVAVPR